MRSSAAPEPPVAATGIGALFVAPDTWRAIDFISDLHLGESTPLTFAAWSGYMQRADCDAVFILGDLFEAWIGDDMAEHGFEQRCLAVLKEAASRLTVGFMAGNRDFLVGDRLLSKNAVMRIPDPTVISAYGTRVMVSHGDALCTGDEAYQRYRRVVRLAGFPTCVQGASIRRPAIGRPGDATARQDIVCAPSSATSRHGCRCPREPELAASRRRPDPRPRPHPCTGQTRPRSRRRPPCAERLGP